MVNKEFQYLIQKFGEPKLGLQLDWQAATPYRRMLPGSIVDFWTEYGLGMWLNGIFQFSPPEIYHSLIATIFKSDVDISPDESVVYGYSAFGTLFIWNQKFNNVHVDLVYQTVTARAITGSEKIRSVQKTLGPDRVIGADLVTLGGGAYESFDVDGNPLFSRALKKLGQLPMGECFGFAPALALGGAPKLENVQRMKAIEHFSILAQLGRFQLIDYSTGKHEVMRDIGAQ